MQYTESVNYVPTDRREKIVKRNSDGQTHVVLAEVRNEDELAYAIRVLMDHYTYKRSKGLGGVSENATREALDAASEAAGSFAEQVMWPQGIEAPVGNVLGVQSGKPVSRLGEGLLINPYEYVS